MDLLPIKDSNQLGAAIRGRRHELERGKESAQFAGIRRVLGSLGLDLYVKPR